MPPGAISDPTPTTKRRRGRPQRHPGEIKVWLSDADYEYVLGIAAREDRPVSRVGRQLIAEAIEARKAGRSR